MNKNVTYSERGLEALLMRLQGKSTAQIGEHLKVSRQRAYQLADRAARRLFNHPEQVSKLIPTKLRPALNSIMARYS